MIEIQLNGQSYAVRGETIADLVAQLRLGGGRYAVEVNREIIPKSDHDAHRLNAGDDVEIIHAVGGG